MAGVNGTLRVSLTGVDGSGKTTIIRRIRQRQDSAGGFYAFRAPQFHEDPSLPHSDLSRAIDDLSVAADLSGNVTVKSLALFLSMTLYGDVENHILQARRPSVLIGERQCFLDALAYARFYQPMLATAAARPAGPAPKLHPLITEWLSVVAARDPSLALDVKDMTGYLLRVFAGEPAAIVGRLMKLFRASVPDRIIILRTTPEDLATRLSEKRAGTAAELHEKAETLQGLDHALLQTAPLLKYLKPSLRIEELITTERSIDESVDAVLGLVQAEAVPC